jgi:hypothetical protein
MHRAINIRSVDVEGGRSLSVRLTLRDWFAMYMVLETSPVPFRTKTRSLGNSGPSLKKLLRLQSTASSQTPAAGKTLRCSSSHARLKLGVLRVDKEERILLELRIGSTLLQFSLRSRQVGLLVSHLNRLFWCKRI